MKAPLIAAAVTAALGGFIFGFDTAVISGTTDALTSTFELSTLGLGFATSSALLGTIAGCVLAGWASDRYGRRNSLILIALLFFVSAIGSALAPEIISFIAFRAIGGIGVGASSVIAAMYIAEISPAKSRGVLVGMFQLNIVIGLVTAFFSNYLITQIGESIATGAIADPNDASAVEEATRAWLFESGWRWMLGVEAFPAALFFVLLFFTPRSPRWLVAKGRAEEARAVLESVGTDTGDVGAEIEAIRASLAHEASLERAPLFVPRYTRPLLLVLLLATFNQLSGINAVMYYAPKIFEAAGASAQAQFLYPVWIGLANIVFTIVGLALIDRLGRKFLLLVGSVGYIVSLATTAFAFFKYGGQDGTGFEGASTMLVLGALALFIASHAIGQGAVIWVYIGEVFPNAVRGKGQSFGCLTHWVWAAAITFAFPSVLAQLGGEGVFALFTLFMIAQLVWVVFFVPETKGVPLEEIELKLNIPRG